MAARPTLASEVFLLAHDCFSGRRLISDELLTCGVVTAQLADLVLTGHLQLHDARIVAAGERPDDGDPVAEYVMWAVLSQPQSHTVRTWVDNLDALPELVARQLIVSTARES